VFKLFLFIFSCLFFNDSWSQDRALIINGGSSKESNSARYYENTKEMFQAYYARGIKREHISVFYADGEENSENTLNEGYFWDSYQSIDHNLLGDNTKRNDINGAAKKEIIRKEIEKMAVEMKAGSTLSVFVTDHGTEEGKIALWGEYMTPLQFKMMIKPLLAKGIKVNITANHCYAGHWHAITEENICVQTNTDRDHVSYSKTKEDPFAKSLSKCLKENINSSLSFCYYKAINADLNANAWASDSRMEFLKDFQKEYEQKRNGNICPTSPTLERNFRNLITPLSTTYVAQPVTPKAGHDIDLKIKKTQEELQELITYWNSLKEKEQNAYRQEYTKQFDELYKKKSLLTQMKSRGIKNFKQEEKVFFENATIPELERYLNILSCLNYAF
jgi:hypothetical protein